MFNLVKAYRSIQNPLPMAKSRTGKPAMVTLKIQLNCSTVHDMTLWSNIYVRSHLGCGTDSVFIRFCRSHKYFKDIKAKQMNRILKFKLNLTCQAQSTPKTITIVTKVFCTSGPYLVVLAWTGDELLCGKSQNGVNFDFEVKFYLEGQGQSPPKTIGILTKVFLHLWSKFGYPSLNVKWVIAWTNLVMDGWMDAGNDNTRRPKLATGKNPSLTQIPQITFIHIPGLHQLSNHSGILYTLQQLL